MERQLLTIEEISDKYHLAKVTIYSAIKKGRLKSRKMGRKWFIWEEDFNAYRASKYSQNNKVFNGQKTFRPEYKEISVHQAAKLLGFSPPFVYELIRQGKIPSIRKGVTIVLTYDDVISYHQKNAAGDSRQLKFA